ncbi:hypothetical protein BT93_H0098 [Corymbia citriodora subsp. variegata]|nr:hypothetical protein BT93_H0098 [Corymbia citriodora subsp. variegata]
MVPPHFLLIALPNRGAMNPALQLAEHLARIGSHVTFLTTVFAHRCMVDPVCVEGLTFTTFSDGYDDGRKPGDDTERFQAEMKRRGSEALRGLIDSSSRQSLSIYYYYFNGYEDVIKNVTSQSCDTTSLIQLPDLPPLANRDVPSFFNLENKQAFVLPKLQSQFEQLNEGGNPTVVLVNTFDVLELEVLRVIGTVKLVGIGALVPLHFLDAQNHNSSDKSSRGDIFRGSEDYVQWCDSKEEASVIYVAFGSIATLSKEQKRGMACGLLETGRAFLWVIRESDGDDDELIFKEELDKKGVIVPWCSQIELLSHRSIGCFFTHCGWNSTLESLACGIPMVAFPQFGDQMTNAKLVEDVWNVGVRASEISEEGTIVEGGEIKKCLELVMGGGERGDGISRNAKKRKDLAMEASKEGGSSDRNLKAFVEEFVKVDWIKCFMLD